MKLGYKWYGFLVCLLLLECGHQADDSRLLARVGDVRISVDDLQAYANEGKKEQEIRTEYRELLQTLVDREILLLEAGLRGIGEDSLVLSRLREHEEERLMDEMLHRQVTARISVTPDEILREFESGGWQEQVKSLQIFVSNSDKARMVLDRLQEGADFEELGRRWSEDRLFKIPTGSAKVFSYSGKDAPRNLVESIFGLSVGEVTEAIEVDRGWVIAKALERRPVQFEEVREKVKSWLTRRKREALRDVYFISLRESHELALNREGIELVMQSLAKGVGANALAAEQRSLSVYTYRGGALTVEDALSTVNKGLRSSADLSEGLVTEKLREVLKRRLVVNHARSQGLDQTAGFIKWRKGKIEDLMIGRLRLAVIGEGLTVSEEEIRARYQERKEHFRMPASARVLDLLVKDPGEARALRREIEAGGDMRGLIRRHGIRENTEEGVLDVFEVQAMIFGEAWLNAVMNAPLNELQGPVESKGGYSLFKVLERRPRDYFKLENERVRTTLSREIRDIKKRVLFNEFLESLRRKHSHRTYVSEDNLARVEAESETRLP